MLVVLAAVVLAIWIPASIAFPAAALVLLAAGVAPTGELLRAVNLRLIIFLGSLLGLGQTAIEAEVFAAVGPLVLALDGLPPLVVIAAFVFVASVIANAVGNVVAPVILMPLAGKLAGASISLDALLMAIAAGASLAVILPTHQATVMAMSRAPFSPGRFARFGLWLVVGGGVLSSLVIMLVWT